MDDPGFLISLDEIFKVKRYFVSSVFRTWQSVNLIFITGQKKKRWLIDKNWPTLVEGSLAKATEDFLRVVSVRT